MIVVPNDGSANRRSRQLADRRSTVQIIWRALLLVLMSILPLAIADSADQIDNTPTRTDKLWRRAIINNDVDTLRSLLQQSSAPVMQQALLADNGKSALMIACKLGELDFVHHLLELGANEHAITHTGGTPFMFASLGGHTQILQLLDRRGVDINAKGANGWSATTIAAAKGYTATLKALLEMGTDINAVDVYQWTPLMRAVDNQHKESVDVLLAHPHIKLDHQDETGNTALHHAGSNADATMIEKLIKAGIDRSILNSSGYSAAQLVSGLPNSAELAALFSVD